MHPNQPVQNRPTERTIQPERASRPTQAERQSHPAASPAPATSRRYLVARVGDFSVRMPRRGLIAAIGITLAALAGAFAMLLIGDYPMSPTQVFGSLLGVGEDALASYFVTELRLPRAVTALAVGAALGLSGGIFQSISNNPLGSPDVIGFTTGSATGALIAIIVIGGGPATTASGALIGGFATAIVVYLLAWRQGLTGTRLVLVGIGIAAVLSGLNSLLITRASLDAAQTAAQWLAGSLNASTSVEAWLVTAALAVLLPSALVLGRPLRMLTFGDDIAIGAGVAAERVRLWLVVIGVCLVSVATAAAGPIAFVALAAPQLASRLSRAEIGLGSSALMGAFLVVASDIVAQRLFAPTQLPVGVVTGALGGIYLIWLLAMQWRRRTA